MSQTWEDELSQFDGEFRKAKEPEGGGADYSVPVPDGTYQAVIKSIELVHSKNSNEPMVKWCFRLIGGNREFLNRWVWSNSLIREGAPLAYLKKDLGLLGIHPPKFSALRAMLPKAVGKVVEIRIVTNGQFKNTYLNRVIQAGAADVPPEDPNVNQASEDDTPF